MKVGSNKPSASQAVALACSCAAWHIWMSFSIGPLFPQLSSSASGKHKIVKVVHTDKVRLKLAFGLAGLTVSGVAHISRDHNAPGPCRSQATNYRRRGYKGSTKDDDAVNRLFCHYVIEAL